MIDTDKIAYCVTRLECVDAKGKVSVGTGFIFGIHAMEGTHMPLLVTNKHVVKDSVQVIFHLTKKDENGNPVFSDYQEVKVKTKGNWKDHPNPEVDLCAMTLGNILTTFSEKLKTEILWSRIMPNNIPSEEDFATLKPVEDVVMVGYPNGIWDQYNNRPIFRKGITATQPGLPYNGKKEFLIDIAAFPGSSGSPVFLYKEGFNVVNTAGTRLAGRDDKFFFVGILYAGHMYNAQGEIKVQEVPTLIEPYVSSRIPTNLGIVINSMVMMEFENVFEYVKNTPPPTEPKAN